MMRLCVIVIVAMLLGGGAGFAQVNLPGMSDPNAGAMPALDSLGNPSAINSVRLGKTPPDQLPAALMPLSLVPEKDIGSLPANLLQLRRMLDAGLVGRADDDGRLHAIDTRLGRQQRRILHRNL